MSATNKNAVRRHRHDRRWSQDELAQRAGISRAAVSAIEQERLTPSVTSALSLARAFGCNVEELFGDVAVAADKAEWAWPALSVPCRYWHAVVGCCRWRYPVESTSVGEIPHDGIWNGNTGHEMEPNPPEDVLVVATCDPAVGLLASEYARQTPFRLLPLTRSSRTA